MISTKDDFNATKGTSEHEQFMASLRGSLFNVYQENGKWFADENNEAIAKFGLTRADFDPIALPILPEDITDEELLINAHTAAKSSIVTRATDTRALLTGHSDYNTVAGWGHKALLAQKVVGKTATLAELAVVKVEADQRGKSETPLQLAKKQLGKAEQLAIAIANIDGMETAGLAALKLCETVEQIDELLTQLDVKAKATLAALTGG